MTQFRGTIKSAGSQSILSSLWYDIYCAVSNFHHSSYDQATILAPQLPPNIFEARVNPLQERREVPILAAFNEANNISVRDGLYISPSDIVLELDIHSIDSSSFVQEKVVFEKRKKERKSEPEVGDYFRASLKKTDRC